MPLNMAWFQKSRSLCKRLFSSFGVCLGEGTLYWVAVKEIKLSYYIGETLLFTTYTHYSNLI